MSIHVQKKHYIETYNPPKPSSQTSPENTSINRRICSSIAIPVQKSSPCLAVGLNQRLVSHISPAAQPANPRKTEIPTMTSRNPKTFDYKSGYQFEVGTSSQFDF